MATQMQERELMATMEGGNLTAIEDKYHLECLTALQNHHRSQMQQHKQESRGFSGEKMMKA